MSKKCQKKGKPRAKSESEVENVELKRKLRKLNAERAMLERQSAEIMHLLLHGDVLDALVSSDDEEFWAEKENSKKLKVSPKHRHRLSPKNSPTNSPENGRITPEIMASCTNETVSNGILKEKNGIFEGEGIKCLFCARRFSEGKVFEKHVKTHSAMARTMYHTNQIIENLKFAK